MDALSTAGKFPRDVCVFRVSQFPQYGRQLTTPIPRNRNSRIRNRLTKPLHVFSFYACLFFSISHKCFTQLQFSSSPSPPSQRFILLELSALAFTLCCVYHKNHNPPFYLTTLSALFRAVYVEPGYCSVVVRAAPPSITPIKNKYVWLIPLVTASRGRFFVFHIHAGFIGEVPVLRGFFSRVSAITPDLAGLVRTTAPAVPD